MGTASRPPLSVVVPVRDGAATLDRCLAALVAGMPDGGDIVVVDDGSTDDTATIAARHPVRLVRNPTSLGTSGARNVGWRATTAQRIGFVDADVVVRPDTLARLVACLEQHPDALGVNGILALDLGTPGRVSAFVNTSIHYQHLCHGTQVASAFTSVCVLTRTALDTMGGWDEHFHSRYADDVASRWSLPPGCLLMDADARAEHLKSVDLRGMLKHRFNVGRHFVQSVLVHREVVAKHPGSVLLAKRYPLNTLNAAFLLGAPVLLPLHLFGAIAINAPFALFTLRNRGAAEALLAIPLSQLEGFAYLFGMWSGAMMRGR